MGEREARIEAFEAPDLIEVMEVVRCLRAPR